MIKTLATALVAASLLAAPAFAQGNASADTAQSSVQNTKSVKHTAAVKTHKAKKHVALHHHRKHVKHVKHAKRHVKHAVKTAG